ncbi:MAG TPA: FAD:protein FMN transferase [Propionibacteriaceae bacterium]|nr:FAD:protein FMN transferase [Propionibacteriaceae bacterium]
MTTVRLPTTRSDRHVFATMGTVVTIAFADGVPEGADAAVERAFGELDARFSLYRPDSEASAVARREVGVREASAEYRAAYDLAVEWSALTERAFTPHRPDGVIDLAGVVKAMAIQAAADALHEMGARNWCLNAGGDVLVDGAAAIWHAGDLAGSAPWVVGIVDPTDRTQLVSQFATSPTFPAVATSGIAERGEHVWRMASSDTFAQVTVAAGDIVTADVLATAILSGGTSTLDLATARWPVEVLAITRTGEFYATPAFRA